VHIVNLSLVVGLFTSGMQMETVAITPVTPPAVLEVKTADEKAPESTVVPTAAPDSAIRWNEFVKSCDSLETEIKTALSKNQLKEGVGAEFHSDLTKIRAHIQAVKPKTNDIGFSQRLVISRDLNDLKAQVDYAIASTMHPHENIETVKSKFLAELDEANKSGKIAADDCEKLKAEVKQQEELLRSMRRSTEATATKDQELIASNFAGLHVVLQQNIQFSRESLPLLEQEHKKIEELLQAASSANTLDSAKCKQYTDSLAKIDAKKKWFGVGPLSSSAIVGLAMELEGLEDIVQNQISTASAQNKQ
jgi:hypothetical protein